MAQSRRPRGAVGETIAGLLGATTRPSARGDPRRSWGPATARHQPDRRLRAASRGGFVAGDTWRRWRTRPGAGWSSARRAAPVAEHRSARAAASARIIVETSASRLHFAGAAAPDASCSARRSTGPSPTSGPAPARRRPLPAQGAGRVPAARRGIALNAAVPWTIELEGGLTDLTGSLANRARSPRGQRRRQPHRPGAARAHPAPCSCASAASSATPASCDRRACRSPCASTAACRGSALDGRCSAARGRPAVRFGCVPQCHGPLRDRDRRRRERDPRRD